MKSYECYKAEPMTTSTGKTLKKLVLQGEGDQYPMKNVTMWSNHPLFEEMDAGWTGELEIEVKDSNTPNPKGGFYKNRTVLNPGQTAQKIPAAAPKEASPIRDRSAEIMNMLELRIDKKLDAIHKLAEASYKEVLAISGRQERQMGLDPKAIDESFGVDSMDEPMF